MIALLLLACGDAPPPEAPAAAPTPPPAPVEAPPPEPDGALVLRLDGDTVQVGSTVIGGLPGPDPAGVLDKVAEAVRRTAATTVVLDAPADARWIHVRQVAVSAREGGVREVRWRLDGTTVGPSLLQERSTGRLAGVCTGDALPVTGVDRRFTVNLEADGDGSWARATARFRPMVGDGDAAVAMEGLEPACWTPGTCSGTAPTKGSAEACEAARASGLLVPGRVAVGGPTGCLAPLWKTDRPAEWPIGATLAALGAAGHDVQLVPEARVRWDVVHATLVSLDAALELPHLPLSLLQGNDGPPLCDAPARTAADVDRALGQWLGGQLANAGG